MIRRWLALTYYLYALRLAALSHFYFNPLYNFEPSNRIAACIKSSLHPPFPIFRQQKTASLAQKRFLYLIL